MKVLLVNTLFPPDVIGGAERSVAILAQSLARSGHGVAVVTLGRQSRRLCRSVEGARVHALPLRNLFWPFAARRPALLKPAWHALDSFNPFMMRGFERILDEEKPDIVHTNNIAGFSVAIWKAAQRRGIPVVHTLRDYYLVCPRSTMYRRNRNCAAQCGSCRAYSFPRMGMSEIPHAVVGISRHMLTAHLALGYFPTAAIKTVVFNPYEPCDSCGLRDGQRREAAHPIRFGYLGRLHPSKGIEPVIEAFRGLNRRDWRLVIAGVGEPDYTRRLQARAHGAQDIVFAGWQDSAAFYSMIDVLVFPSLWHEPLGRGVIEAFAHGVPVIASRRGGIPETIEAGVNGLLFDQDEPGALSDAIGTFLDRPEMLREMTQRCVDSARAFAPQVIASQYARIYRDVLGRETG